MHTKDYIIDRPTSLSPDVALTWSSGFLATLAITTTMYVLPAAGLPQVDLPIWVARLFVEDPVQVGAVGLAVHLIAGFAFAWLAYGGVLGYVYGCRGGGRCRKLR